ncbi:uncharacterized protein EV420DRAFT_245695 [Desarmillaria tabescens]|uniref:Uncharacterized protein n=1 Tax=Armillaria tabescens TaxID=1929756 RepID=A0AA39KHM7_ARMTA|nr:uncharacterized protein EV420DRAFT_245695 [Desarmillaria tabescens]KAK0459999.1 hypothetical protein EV420DRAFT_245695 [Desarmillaria tabescens]
MPFTPCGSLCPLFALLNVDYHIAIVLSSLSPSLHPVICYSLPFMIPSTTLFYFLCDFTRSMSYDPPIPMCSCAASLFFTFLSNRPLVERDGIMKYIDDVVGAIMSRTTEAQELSSACCAETHGGASASIESIEMVTVNVYFIVGIRTSVILSRIGIGASSLSATKGAGT